ncbi:lipopolysaccharide biosynthesis protein [Aureibaculum luteum]|uniref:lipopolysaccharide biosynthesis protein n=1 Tax=Aureibaculum luteum TaxID=1548456 RepID=UPI000E51A91C|nr:lipopolysaccharide biosynthesis protein [Aureibaculum luteum]
MKTLKQKSIDAIIWNLIQRYGNQIFSIIIGVILARLLTPADYGLIGMITVFFALAMVFVNGGFGLAFIQKKNADDTDASTIFFFNLFTSIFFYIILWFTAPLIAKFYDQNQLIDLIHVASIVLIINSFSMMQIVKLTKEVNFKKKTIISLASTLISGTVGIIAALNNFGVWSLVFQQLTSASTNAIGLWFFYDWRPKFIFKIDSLKSMLSFSWWSLLSSIITTLFNNIYILTIGKFFPVEQLGFYTKAKGYQSIVSQQPASAISAVSFPVFSKLQDDKIALKNSLKKFTQHTIFFIAPFSALLIVIADPLILVVLTEKWLPMVPYFKLLLVSGIFYPLLLYNGLIINSLGRTKLNFKINLSVNFFRILNIVLMYKLGVIYIIYGEIVVSVLAIFMSAYYTKRLINYGVFDQLKDLFIILFISIIIVILGSKFSIFIINLYAKIIFGILFVTLLYLGLSYLFNKKLFFEFLQNFKNLKK